LNIVPIFNQHRLHFDALCAAALRAVDPAAAIRRSFSAADFADAKRVFVVGAGKAGVAMTQAAADILGDRLTAAVVSVPVKPTRTCERIVFIAGGHPVPNEGSISAGRAMAELLAQTTDADLVIALISGGGSALLELPHPGLNLADLQNTTDALLKCGATIHEINSIRARLSQLKGGGLTRSAYPARVLGLILSDVVGNNLDVVASGPTVPLSSSTEEPWAIVDKYSLQAVLPIAVLECLKHRPSDEKSARNSNRTLNPSKIALTPSPSPKGRGEVLLEPINPSPQVVENRLVACNRMAGEAAAAVAKELGFEVFFLADDWQGEAREVAERFAQLLIDSAGHGPKCYIVGGETTVTIRGKGKGGRNQEAALAAAMAIAGRSNIALAAFATDGVDGPTDAAGAIVTGDTVKRAGLLGLDPQCYLDDNNSYPLLHALGDLIETGPTGTNVNDLLFGLVY
jgi:glycerate 2-kinase